MAKQTKKTSHIWVDLEWTKHRDDEGETWTAKWHGVEIKADRYRGCDNFHIKFIHLVEKNEDDEYRLYIELIREAANEGELDKIAMKVAREAKRLADSASY